jgi:hypothetical protein
MADLLLTGAVEFVFLSTFRGILVESLRRKSTMGQSVPVLNRNLLLNDFQVNEKTT